MPERTIVKAQSHRARARILALIGEDAQCLCSLRRDTTYGAYQVPPGLLDQVLALKGVVKMRDGTDLMSPWSGRPDV